MGLSLAARNLLCVLHRQLCLAGRGWLQAIGAVYAKTSAQEVSMTDPLLALLYRLNQNQNVLAAAIKELAIWGGQRGSVEHASQVKLHCGDGAFE